MDTPKTMDRSKVLKFIGLACLVFSLIYSATEISEKHQGHVLSDCGSLIVPGPDLDDRYHSWELLPGELTSTAEYCIERKKVRRTLVLIVAGLGLLTLSVAYQEKLKQWFKRFQKESSSKSVDGSTSPDKIGVNFCSSCGTKVEPDDVFCSSCGKKLN
tara:strand:+ start:280 stop:753 length:474 start_codon:yes stop_codon:yes gene_type:complete